MKKFLTVAAVIAALVLGTSVAAQAVSGTSLGSGSVTVENVWTSEAYTFPAFTNTTRTIDLDCPSGKEVVTGFGIWVIRADGSATSVSGSALDSDTWRVSFNYNGSPSLPSTLQVHATCN